MTNDLSKIRQLLISMLEEHANVLKTTINNEEKYEVTGTIVAMQGKKKVDGMYFATVAPKPKDIRFYFFPIYTHVEQYEGTLSEDMLKALKGKSCFHIKSVSKEMEQELKALIDRGIVLYQQDGLLAK